MRFILPIAAVACLGMTGLRAMPVINEVQSTNTSLPDQYGQLIDWVEIHNPTGAPIDLVGYHLSDSTVDKVKFRFSTATVIQPGAYLVVWCGQAAEFPTTGPYPAGQARATNFNISSAGETVVLTAPDGTTVVDELPALAIGTNPSTGLGRTMGRGTGANLASLFFYEAPTFGAANTASGYPTYVPEPPAFSLPAGYYTETDISVTISPPSGVTNAVIRYTLDGSEPATNSPVYTGPLVLNASTARNTNSYVPTNTDPNPGPPLYEGWQPPAAAPFRINVLRARLFEPGKGPGRVQTASYIQHPAGAARYSLPLVSIAAASADLFSNNRGIYVPGFYNNMFQEGSEWERPANIEFFETDGTLAFGGTIGLRLHGNTTRSRPRKSLRIYARNPYGPSTFEHRIFPQKTVGRFDTFLLRNAGNDWGNSLFRDALVTSLAAPTGLDLQSSRPAAVFISGEYWGIHNLRDRIDEAFFFHHYGLGAADFSQIEVVPTSDSSVVVPDNGSAMGVADFQQLLDRAASTGFAAEADYAFLASRIDVDNYIDYNAFEIWSGNTDWPGNNYRLWRSVTADTAPGADPRHDGRWRWILFDTDFGLGADFFYVPGHNADATAMAQFNSLAHATSTGAEFFSNREPATRLLRRALENTGFRNKFVNRFADLLNTGLSAAHATAKLDEFVALYGPEIPEHVSRWRQPYNWSNDVARIREYMVARPSALRGHLLGKFGLAGTADLTLGVSHAGRGTVTVNSVSIDPSTPGIASPAYPWTGVYFRGVPVSLTASPRPGYRFSSWTDSEATNTGTTTVLASDSTSSYGSWNDGGNGGFGFQAWDLADTGSLDDGFFIANSGRAIHSLSPDGRSFGIYAHSGGSADATRVFSGGSLGTNHTFAAVISPGSFNGRKGVALGSAGTNRISFYSGTGNRQSRYYFANQGAVTIITNVFAPDTNSTFNFSVTHLGGNVHRVTIARGTAVFTTNAALSGPLDRAFFYNTNSADSGDVHNIYFNNLSVTRPGSGGSTNAVDPSAASVAVNLSGPRTLTANFEFEPATTLVIDAPAVVAPGAWPATVVVRAVNSVGDTDPNFTGRITLRIGAATLEAEAIEGVATFPWQPAGLGSYQLEADADGLAAAAPASLVSADSATFLPAGTADWHAATNWDTGVVPDSTLAAAAVPASGASNRDVRLLAPATVAAIVFRNGDSAFRNRVREFPGSAGNVLTLQSADGPATITVEGTGAGHGNIEVAPGVVMGGDLVLDVRNIHSTNAEYGALRLQGAWSGAGTITKRGAGMAGITGTGKTFSGQVVVEQGVLTFSEPAVSGNNITNYTVRSGGQLRLSSAFVTAGTPRTNHFKGPLHLAGAGRAGVPDNANLGVLGALRLETGGTGTAAVLTNAVHLADSADIHVPAGNTIRLEGPLRSASGTNVLTKSGGGTLALGAAAASYEGALAVDRGTLFLDNAVLTNTHRTLLLSTETSLAGTGRWGGALEVSTGAVIAAVLGPSPAATAPLRAGSVEIGGPAIVNVSVDANAGPGLYPVLVSDAGFVGASDLSLAGAPTNFAHAGLLLSNNILHVVLAETAPGEIFAQWSGGLDANSDADGNGFTALAEFALGAAAPSAAPVPPAAGLTNTGSADYLTLTAVVRTNSPNLSVDAERAAGLGAGESWTSEGIEVVSTTDDVPANFERRTYRAPATNQSGFLRLIFRLAP